MTPAFHLFIYKVNTSMELKKGDIVFHLMKSKLFLYICNSYLY